MARKSNGSYRHHGCSSKVVQRLSNGNAQPKSDGYQFLPHNMGFAAVLAYLPLLRMTNRRGVR